MKPAADSNNPHHLLELLLAALVAAVTALLFAGAVWAVWEFVMGLVVDNWPEWLRICGVK